MTKRALLIMAKRPFPGQTKTRLCPPFTAEQAAALYQCFLQDAIAMAQSVPNVTRFIAAAPPGDVAYFSQLAPEFEQLLQQGPTLSERLDHVMTYCSRMGYGQVVAINSDSPTLPADLVNQAFTQLDKESVDVVLGPSEDGGYYLIGWKRPNPRLVRRVKMSTPHVLQETLRIAGQESLKVALLSTWYDIDSVTQLQQLAADLAASPQLGHHTRQFLRRIGASSAGLATTPNETPA